MKLEEKELVVLRPDIDDSNVKRIYEVKEIIDDSRVIVKVKTETPVSDNYESTLGRKFVALMSDFIPFM